MGRVSDAKEKLMKAVAELIWTGSYGTTTIDQICERAGVKKGSFYYFFDSKADLAEAAVAAEWQEFRKELDAFFSPTIPPLERIRAHCEATYREQLQMKEKHGHVLGCPMCTLGAEVCTQESRLKERVQEVMEQGRRYYETAIRDAHALGQVHAPDAAQKASIIYTYMEGLLTRARIQDDVDVLKEALPGIHAILGIKAKEPVIA